MRRGRDTGTIRLDRQAIKEIVANCSEPEIMREILQVKTWDLAMGRISLLDFQAYCRSLPCIFWQPEDGTQRNVTVRIAGEVDRVMIKVTRVVWTACQITSDQGTMLGAEEELLHTCGNNGHHSSAKGACLNPAHLLRGDEKTRQDLRKARAKFDKVMKRQTAVSVAS